MRQPDSDMNNSRQGESPKHVSLGQEVFDRLDPSSTHEGVLPSKQGQIVAVLILIAVFWTAFTSSFVFYENILDEAELGIGTLIFALPPLIFIAVAVLGFIWWFSCHLATWNNWGRANQRVARWFWFIALFTLSAIYFDPLNKLHFLSTNFPTIGPINTGYFAIYAYAVFLFVVLLWDNFQYGAKRTAFYLSEWYEMLISILLGMKITGLHFVRPRLTELFPEQKPNLAPAFRGRHILAFDEKGEHLCIACKACEKICPDRLIVIESVRNPETKKLVLTGFILDNSRCSFCGLCEDVCPTGAIRHTPQFEYSAFTRDDLVIDIFGEWIEKTKDKRKDTGEWK